MDAFGSFAWTSLRDDLTEGSNQPVMATKPARLVPAFATPPLARALCFSGREVAFFAMSRSFLSREKRAKTHDTLCVVLAVFTSRIDY